MSEFKLKEQIQKEIKNDISNHYSSLKTTVDIESQKIINEPYLMETDKEKVFKESIFLVKRIECIFSSNMNDINNFFASWSQNDEEYWSNCNEKNPTMIKEEFKKKILSSYLIYLKNENLKIRYDNFKKLSKIVTNKEDIFGILGLYLEFDYYIDEQQKNFIKEELNTDIVKRRPNLLINKQTILNKFSVGIFMKYQIKSNNSYYKMPNTSRSLGFVKESPFSELYKQGEKCIIEKDAFSVMPNLTHLDLICFFDGYTKFELKNGCFNDLSSLEELYVNICEFSDNNIFSGLHNLKKLKLSTSIDINPNVFDGLDNLIELDVEYSNDVKGSAKEADISINKIKLKSLEILRISLDFINLDCFKNFSNLKELCIENLSLIDENAFISLENLVKLNLSNSKITKLKLNSFQGLISLKELLLENQIYLKQIDRGAFNGLLNLEQLSLDITELETYDYIFEDLFNLKGLKLVGFQNEKVNHNNPFQYLDKLESIESNEFVQFSKMFNYNELKEIKYVSMDHDTDAIRKIKSPNIKDIESLDLKGVNPELPIIGLNMIDVNFFKGFDRLKKLKLTNFLIRIDPTIFSNLVNLEYLDLSHNVPSFRDKNDCNDIFNNLKNLLYLRFSAIRFNISSLHFVNLNNLRHLDLTRLYISLTDKIFESLSNLELLDLSFTTIEDSKVNELTFFGLKNLKKLYLKYCNKINKLSSNTFKYSANLIHIDLHCCQINSVDLDAFGGLSKLQTLVLSLNHIELLSEKHFSELVSLRKLKLSENPFIYRLDIHKFYKNLNIDDLDLIIH